MNWCLITGILLNCALILVNRFIHKLPDKAQIPLVIVAVALMIVGIVQFGMAYL